MIPTSTNFVSIMAGETRYFQAWHRDITGLGTPTSNYTLGLRTILPERERSTGLRVRGRGPAGRRGPFLFGPEPGARRLRPLQRRGTPLLKHEVPHRGCSLRRRAGHSRTVQFPRPREGLPAVSPSALCPPARSPPTDRRRATVEGARSAASELAARSLLPHGSRGRLERARARQSTRAGPCSRSRLSRRPSTRGEGPPPESDRPPERQHPRAPMGGPSRDRSTPPTSRPGPTASNRRAPTSTRCRPARQASPVQAAWL